MKKSPITEYSDSKVLWWLKFSTLKAMSSAMKKSAKMITEALLAVPPALLASSPHWMVVRLAPAPLNVMYVLPAATVTFSLHNLITNKKIIITRQHRPAFPSDYIVDQV